VVLDPYARAVLSRRRYGALGPKELDYTDPDVLGLAQTWPQVGARGPAAAAWRRPLSAAQLPRSVHARRLPLPLTRGPAPLNLLRPPAQMAAWLPAPGGDGFDWQGDRPLGLPMEDLVVYEMHVRGFTEHPSSGVEVRPAGAGWRVEGGGSTARSRRMAPGFVVLPAAVDTAYATSPARPPARTLAWWSASTTSSTSA
jgi:isoamylase